MTAIRSIGFVGLGVMGEAMCRNLIRKSGLPVMVYDVTEAPVQRLTGDGARPAQSPAGVAAEVVFCSLPGHTQLEEVLTGAAGLLAGLSRLDREPDQESDRRPTIVDLGTTSVESTRRLAALAQEQGINYCDAPVARTRQAAVDGTLAVMVGGDRDIVEQLESLLRCLATDVTYCGPVGSGQMVKQLNNMVLFENVVAIAEAHAIATAAGLDGALLFHALSKGSADSFALRNHGMRAILSDDYPQNAFSTDYALKDLDYALELAAASGVRAQGAQLAHHLLEAAQKAGWNREYFPVLRRTIGPTGEIPV
jgi:3-hydroxyisobutyrate dehydrogenase-like beta-hydroxyacid dehydrogenase